MERSGVMFNAVLVAGLLASVRVMMSGVEHGRANGASVVRARMAMLAGGLTSAGFVGSLLTRIAATPALLGGGVSLALLLGVASAWWLVRRAAAMPVTDHEFDPRFALQGVPAVVLEAIPPEGDGIVQLVGDASPVRAPMRARSIDGAAIAPGVEVGVERIDGDVVFVEAWSAIEARL